MQTSVKDIWLAIAYARVLWFKLLFIGIVLLAPIAVATYAGIALIPYTPDLLFGILRGLQDPDWFQFLARLYLGLMHLAVGRVFWAYNRGIQINVPARTISWPASDVENGLLDIITFKSLRGHLSREQVRLDSVRDVRNDTQGGSASQQNRLNVTGTFGSRQLEFSNKQKRDECRSQIIEALNQVGVRAQSDPNLDFH